MPMVAAMFAPFGSVQCVCGRGMTADDVSAADILLVRSVTAVNKALLAHSKVRFVGTATIGTDHIDQSYLRDQGITFSNASGCNADAVVEYVLSVIYLLADKYGWNPVERTYGIVGVGNVGGRLYERFKQLGFKVLLNDPLRQKASPDGLEFVSLHHVLAEADTICLHTPLTQVGTDPTYHLIGSKELRELKEGALLINAGRGAVVDNAALLEVGKARADLHYVLDVWEHEPVVDGALAERCEIVSPHIAGYSLDGKIRGTYMLLEALCQFLGEPPPEPLASFLPKAEWSSLQQRQLSPLELMRMIYDPREDDRLLRETLHLSTAEQQAAFDRLRKQYRVRREFSSLTVVPADEATELRALGFQIADRT